MQDLWAQVSERLSDSYGIELKYGGGPPHAARMLENLAQLVARFERFESNYHSQGLAEIFANPEEYHEIANIRSDLAKHLAALRDNPPPLDGDDNET